MRESGGCECQFRQQHGAHDGSSLLESYIDTVSQIWKNNIIIAAGNNAVSAGHFRTVMISEKIWMQISVSVNMNVPECSDMEVLWR